MKKKVLLFTLAVFFLLGTTSCSNDDNSNPTNVEKEIPNTLEDEFFTIDGATFKEGEIPVGDKNSVKHIRINKYVINGGKTIMTITSADQLDAILVALKGHDGFYDFKLQNETLTRTNEFTYEVIVDLSQKLSLENFELAIAGRLMDGTMTETQYVDLQLVAAGTGELQISLSWDLEDDVDLHLVNQEGQRIYYGNKTLLDTEGIRIAELDIDSNPGCSIDEIKNENIYFNDLKTDGVYSIYVDLYSKCQSPRAGSKYIVNVMYNGSSIRLSEHMMGKFNDNDEGSGNTPSRHVLIGSFSIINGQFSSIVETETTTRSGFDFEEELVYKN
ncbi:MULTISPECIES: hypothetical protein [unclassified Myroides]|uniref:hypothetical protein n=1 Tax=unclassified Myroides TaxID=2642485 RepID=UPI003D2F62A4